MLNEEYLEIAFEHYNIWLWDGKLPRAEIVLLPEIDMEDSFAWTTRGDTKHPVITFGEHNFYSGDYTNYDIDSTLVHEMSHIACWRPGDGHDEVWADSIKGKGFSIRIWYNSKGERRATETPIDGGLYHRAYYALHENSGELPPIMADGAIMVNDLKTWTPAREVEILAPQGPALTPAVIEKRLLDKMTALAGNSVWLSGMIKQLVIASSSMNERVASLESYAEADAKLYELAAELTRKARSDVEDTAKGCAEKAAKAIEQTKMNDGDIERIAIEAMRRYQTGGRK